jgi:hypothetical protein
MPIRVPLLFLVAGLLFGAACGADEAREAVIGELAVGSWACVPDAPGAADPPMTVQIDDDGTFGVSIDGVAGGELSGSWTITDGDLAWSFDGPLAAEPFVVRGVDDLTLDSIGFTIENAGPFEANADDPTGEQEVDVEVHDKDSVTFSILDGTPWTCNRE